MSAWKTLPLALLELAFVQTQTQNQKQMLSGARAGLTTRSYRRPDAPFVRNAHALALKLEPSSRVDQGYSRRPAPDLRGGYLPVSTPTRPLLERAWPGRHTRSGSKVMFPAERRGSMRSWVRRGLERDRERRIPKTAAAAALQQRVEALVEQKREERRDAVRQEEAEEVTDPEAMTYDEAELQDLYTDLLAHEGLDRLATKTEAEKAVEGHESAARILEAVAQRIGAVRSERTDLQAQDSVKTLKNLSSPSLAARLTARQAYAEEANTEAEVYIDRDAAASRVRSRPLLDPGKVHHSILFRVADTLWAIEDARRVIGEEEASASIVLLSLTEWDALVRTCLESNEMEAAEYTLELMKQSGVTIPEELLNEVTNVYARIGNVDAVVALFNRFVGKATERQRDLHIKAHLRSPSEEKERIESALNVLHNYEALALLPPVQSYTRLVTALFSARSAQHQAQAWDLFAHMRYVAHPTPDPLLYALMIRACAGTGVWQSSYSAQPERALDLWTEMRGHYPQTPSVGAYNAIIMACARSKAYTNEAFRLAREMLDSHRDAFGTSQMQPDRHTFIALLVAAKAKGDLPRARWLLAEMLSFRERERERYGGKAEAIAPDEKILMHIFHVYASHKPTFRRGGTKIVDEKSMDAAGESQDKSADTSDGGKAIEEIPLSKGRFGVTPPQTHAEILSEAMALFERIMEDTGRNASLRPGDSRVASGVFSKVEFNTTLLNSYLMVHYAHGSLEETRQQFRKIFSRVGVKYSLRSYFYALERCASTPPSHRDIAYEFASEIWPECIKLAESETLDAHSARFIERAYAAMIKITTLVGDLDGALSLLRAFVARYPPYSVSMPIPKPAMRSTRSILFAARPIVRLTTATEVPDDRVPPLLAFSDLEILHHRLVIAGSRRIADINYVKYVCKAYEGALRKRRDATIRS
ncbi:hypothetical protein EW145_g3981 [Phellinidium pouzarii]|uniref:Pentacotripeptide-repeat region of PRORP domain-containing protein n=1 Tax=Phellinidium pouzarii TaxID=167371 RepID=A0A4S4LAB3_9AGAM|nr:hypothetical protein EW145_g3981 [Phellinidium pouzarii]